MYLLLAIALSVAVGALSMPTTINSGYYSCVGPSTECTVPTTKTTLNVQNMVNDAVGVGNTSATFTAVRPTFVGFIDINAPTTATMAIPIHIRIEDGYGYNVVASSTFYYIYLRGKLSTGSTISITGGSYTEISSTVHFIRIPSTFELSGGSSILLSNVQMKRLRILQASNGVATTLSGGSSISIVNVTEDFHFSSIYVGGTLTLTGGSTWSLTNSTLSMSASTNDAFWSNKAVTISGAGSALIFTSNTLYYTTGGTTANSESCLRFELALTMSASSRIQASYNTLTAQGTGPMEFVFAIGTTTLSNGVEIEIKGNTLNVSCPGVATLFYFNQATAITDSTTVSVVSNNVTHLGQYYLPLYFGSTLSLSSQSAVSVISNTLTLNNQFISIFYPVGVVVVDSGSSMAVDSNTFHFTINADASFSATGYFFSNNVYLTNGGAISFNTNTFKVNLVNPNLNAGFTLLSCANTLDISHGSNLQVIENNIQAKINASGVASLRLVEIGNLNVVDSSSVNMSYNDIDAEIHSETSTGVLNILQLVGASSNVYVHNNSTFTVQNNNVVRGDIYAISLYRGGIFFDGNTAYSIENTSTLAVAGNKANLTQRNDAEVFGIYTSSLKINSNSILLLQSNDVSILFENSAARPKFQVLYISVLSMSNSSIEISHHRVTLQIVSGTTSIVVFYWILNWGFELHGTGLVRIHHNTLESGGNATRLFASVLGVFPDNSIDTNRVSMNESSTIVITNNVIESGFGECWLLYISSSDVTLNTTITGGSTIYIQDNYIPGVVGTSPIIRLCGLFTTTYFGGNSSLYITNNTAINDVGTVRVFETTSTAPVVLDDMRVVIERNRVEMAGKPDTMTGKPMVNLIGNITEYFRLLFINNVITTNINLEGTSSSGLLYVVSIDFKNSYPSLSEPLLIVQGNTITGIGNNQTSGGGYGCFMVFLQATAPVSSAMTPSEFPKVEVVRVVNNSITTTNFNMTDIMRVNFTSHVDPFSVALANNTVSSDTLSVSRLATVTMSNTTTLFSLSTCSNIVNNHMCHETAQGTHSCIAYNASQVFINDCETSTLTPSYTPSLTTSLTYTPHRTQSDTSSSSISRHTLTDSHVSTVSDLLTKSSTQQTTQSDPLSSTISRIPTPSQTSNHTPTLEATPSLTLPLSTTKASTPTTSLLRTPTVSPQTHSQTAESTLSLPPSATLPPTPTTSLPTTHSPSTTHPTATPSKSESVNTVNPASPCNMGCSEVTSAHLAGVDVTTGPCSSAMIPFEATRDDAFANVVMHLNNYARKRINASVVVSDPVPLRTEMLSDGDDGSSALVEMWGLREGAEYREVWLHVRRDDVTPLNRLDVRVALPAYCFLCRHDNDAVGGGLPWVDVSLAAPPAVLSGAALAVVTAGAAASSFLTTDLQTVAAMGMLGCAPRGDDSGESDNVRALVPVSLGDTCEDAVWGALITMAGVGLLSGVAVLIHRRVKGQPWTQTCAAVFSPSIFLQAWGMLQMGLVVCGGRLVQQEQGSVAVGCVGLLVGLAIVPCYIILANRVISRRCYRLGLTDKAPKNKAVRAVMYVVLPRYELNKEEMPACKAFTVVVGRTRYRWSGWAGIWVIQPVVMLMCVFAKDELCLGMYIAAAACLGLLGLLHLVVRPHRTLLPNLLTCIALLINGGLVLVGSMLAYDPLDPVLRDISYHLSLAQTALTVIRTLLQVSTFIFMRVMRHSLFQAVSGDGVVVEKPEPIFEVIGWLDPPTKEGSTSPSVGLLTLEEHDEDDLSSISTEAVPLADRGGDVDSYQHHHSDEDDEDEMDKTDVNLVDGELVSRQQEYTHEHDDVKEEVVEEIPPTCPVDQDLSGELPQPPSPPSPPRRPPVVVNHQIGRIGSHNQQLGGALGIDLPSSNGGDRGPSATLVIGGLESQGNIVVQPDEIDVLLQDFEGEVIIHNHVYDEGGMMVATSAGGARVQALDAESTAHIPIPHPPNYVRPCASDTARHNLADLIQMICERQQGRGRMYARQSSDVPTSRQPK